MTHHRKHPFLIPAPVAYPKVCPDYPTKVTSTIHVQAWVVSKPRPILDGQQTDCGNLVHRPPQYVSNQGWSANLALSRMVSKPTAVAPNAHRGRPASQNHLLHNQRVVVRRDGGWGKQESCRELLGGVWKCFRSLATATTSSSHSHEPHCPGQHGDKQTSLRLDCLLGCGLAITSRLTID